MQPVEYYAPFSQKMRFRPGLRRYRTAIETVERASIKQWLERSGMKASLSLVPTMSR
jgi:hypothetical protein